MQLQTWRKNAGISQSAFGELLIPPITQAQVSQYELGVTRITLEYALQIDRLSNGSITPKECADLFNSHLPTKEPA
jgi:DNA-binding transcriptional regulator YdaS (Cro superfamily)